MALTFSILSWVGGFLMFGLIARLLAATFSEKSRQQIRKHRIWHLIWISIVVVFVICIYELPIVERQKWIKNQLVKIRQNTQLTVSQAGGWNVLRTEVKSLLETNELGESYWHFDARQNPELTNLYPLIAKLHLWYIRYAKNFTNDGYAFIQVYFTQWGGGRGCTRYYYLMLTPTNYDGFLPSFVSNGDKLLKLTNSVYEITWHF